MCLKQAQSCNFSKSFCCEGFYCYENTVCIPSGDKDLSLFLFILLGVAILNTFCCLFWKREKIVYITRDEKL